MSIKLILYLEVAKFDTTHKSQHDTKLAGYELKLNGLVSYLS